MKLNELKRTYQFPQSTVDTAKNFYRKIPTFSYDSNGNLDANNFDDDGNLIEDELDYLSDEELVNNMRNIGWTEAHTKGYYSNVFLKPGEPYAIKINKRLDRSYAWFALIAAKFPNEHFPKIGNAKIFKVGSDNYRMYAIEKLKPFEYTEERHIIANLCRWSASTKEDTQQQLSYWKEFENMIPTLKEQTNGLISACQILQKYNKGFFVDIHYNNIMLRNNTVVITDPFTV